MAPRSPEYEAWVSMRKRCNSPSHAAYPNYGARGIIICDRWSLFENFLEDMGPRPEGMSLDRKNNAKGYSPDNCRWATKLQQCRNKRSNIYVTIGVETKCIAEWCLELGVRKGTI